MTVPSPEQQLKFLTDLQRLLAEGQFVATYKYALLLALADIAIESGDDSGNALPVSTRQIAEKVILYYWRQVVPYVPKSDPAAGQVLRQNTGRQAAILQKITTVSNQFRGSLAAVRRDTSVWQPLVREVDQVVRVMPLWKLQTVGGSNLDFLYENRGRGTSIELRAGVAYCLRRFHGLLGDLVRGAWVRYVRRHNHDLLGTTADLSEFLFGSERSDLSTVRDILEEVQAGRCFYCSKAVSLRTGQVDHFIPWSRYPLDLGHNFVVAHQACNRAKSDHLAGAEFLAAWVERNRQHRDQLAEEFSRCQVLHDLPTSVRIANWAYQTTFEAGGLTWVKQEQMVALREGWEQPLAATWEQPD